MLKTERCKAIYTASEVCVLWLCVLICRLLLSGHALKRMRIAYQERHCHSTPRTQQK